MLIQRMRPMRPAGLPEPARLLQDMERLFDAAWGTPLRERRAGVFPPLNVTRDANHYYVRAELPGVSPDDLEITVVGNKLTLAGRRPAVVEEGVSYHRRERQSGAFNRTVTLPTDFDANGVQARSAAGVLTITLPLAESSKARRIAVQTA